MAPGNPSCQDCVDTWNGDPPCDECKKPKFLFPNNELALHLWRVCNFYSRPYGAMGGIFPLPISEIKAACEAHEHEARFEDFEKILLIEKEAFPMIQDGYNNQQQDKKKKK